MWYVLALIILLEITLNFTRQDTRAHIKEHPKIIPYLVIHHIANCFLLYGWILNNTFMLIFHALCCVFIIIYWHTNKYCQLTVHVNKIVGTDDSEPFKDILYMLGFKSIPLWNVVWNHVLVIAIAFISIYKIRNNIKKSNLKIKNSGLGSNENINNKL